MQSTEQPAIQLSEQVENLFKNQIQTKYDDVFNVVPHAADIDQLVSHSDSCYESTVTCCGSCAGTLRTFLPCVCCMLPYPYQQVEQQEVALIEHFGKYSGILKPGFHALNPFTHKAIIVDTTQKVKDLPAQIIMTKDNLTIQMNGAVYYEINDAPKAYYRVEDVDKGVLVMASSALRVIMGLFTLQEILEKREKIAQEIKSYVDEHTDEWGIKVGNFVIKDILLSQNMQQVMSSAAQAVKLGEAKVISSSSDVKAALLVNEAAALLSTKEAMQIRYLELLSNTASQGTTPKNIYMPLGRV